MEKKAKGFCLFLVALLLLCAASSLVSANFKPAPLPPLHISNNGEVSPPSNLIVRDGDIYTFTGNLTTMFLQVERSNIVIHGKGFFIVGNTIGFGISLHGVQNVSVSNLGIAKTNVNIYLDECSKVKIDSCTTVGGSYGVYLNASNNNIITGNKLSSFYGIYLEHSTSNILKNNSIQPSSSYALNFMVTGESLADYKNDVDSSNLINGKSIIYWVDRQNAIVPANSSYVALINCKAIVVQNQQISKTQGILIAWTTNSTVTDNRLYENCIGIQMLYSSNIRVSGNEIWKSIQTVKSSGDEEGGDGINLLNSHFITVVNNQVTDNFNGGITCDNSSRNQLIGNTIAQNSRNGINLLTSSDSNLVSQNHLSNHQTNSRGAIYIENSRSNNFISNNLTDNGCWAIQLKGNQGDNTFYGNNFIHNSYRNTMGNPDAVQISTPGTSNGNNWDNGSYGNYWSDYDGSGKYFINENNIDHYPLSKQVEINSIVAIPTTNTGPDPISINPLPIVLGVFAIFAILAIAMLFYKRYQRARKEI